MNKTIVKLFVICLLFISINQIILSLDNKPLFFDAKNNNFCSYNIFNKLFEKEHIDCGVEIFRPPLMRGLSFSFMLVFGMSGDTSLIFNHLFIFVLIFSVYYLGKYFFSKRVGFFSAILIFLMPGIFSLSRAFKEAFIMTAIIALNFYILLKSDYFKNKKYSYLFGIILGLGLLIMPSYLIYIIGPLGYIFIKIFFMNNKKTRISNFFISIVFTIIVSGWWYLNNIISTFNLFVNQVIFNSIGGYSYYELWYEPQGLTFYFLALFVIQLSIPLSIFLFIALKKYFKQPNNFLSKENSILIGLFLFVPFIFFMVISVKSVRHTLPLLSVIVIFVCGALFNKKTQFYKLLVYLLFSIAIIQFIFLNLNILGYGKFLDSYEYHLDPSFEYYSPDVKDALYYPIINYSRGNITPLISTIKPLSYDKIMIIPFDYELFGDLWAYSFRNNYRWIVDRMFCDDNFENLSSEYVLFVQNPTSWTKRGVLPGFCNQNETLNIIFHLQQNYELVDSKLYANRNVSIFKKITN